MKKYICPICQDDKVDDFLDAPYESKMDTKVKLCCECKPKVIMHNETHKDDRICEICGFPVETSDEWVRICELCQSDILVHNHSLDVRAKDYDRRYRGFFPMKKGDVCKIKCIDCGKRVEVDVNNTKTERCEECSLLRKRKMCRIRKQKSRMK